MKTNVLISFLLLACLDAVGQEKLVRLQTEYTEKLGRIWVFPDNQNFTEKGPIANAVRQDFLTDEEWKAQQEFINSITQKILTENEIDSLEHREKYSNTVIYLVLDGEATIIDVYFHCYIGDFSILTDEKLQQFRVALKGKRLNMKIYSFDTSLSKSEWRACHALHMYTYSFE